MAYDPMTHAKPHRIRCRHGGVEHSHETAREVAFCATQHQGFPVAVSNIKTHTAPELPKAAPATGSTYGTWRFITPEVMVRGIRKGRYCVELGANMRKFFKVDPEWKGKKFKGATVISSQHSESFKVCLVLWPDGRHEVHRDTGDLDRCLMMIAADPYTSKIRYGQEMGVCCNCGKKLTDDRSRWYGIGPECEKDNIEIINEVNNSRGMFVKE
jgi:hypothetical protein